MTDFAALKADISARMDKAADALKRDFASLRTGRASPALLDSIVVDAYGEQMRIDQLGSINVPEPRLLSISVWDKSMVKAIEKAITESNMGLNPSNDGTLIRLPIPPITEERRTELVKAAGKFTENARIAVRNLRREAMDSVKAWEKGKQISKDELERFEAEIQKITDSAVKTMDDALAHKETEIKQV
ncbi:MAG: ribosome recycling factor [Alphaproteobacteria bacterium]|nr:ribosome recycling factor [Alphaproteobacteria bacterium]